ncbi:MAG: ATP-dependent DNA helicase RecG, partial [Lachnospiraceae bacterium]|nr:ATP-dependent DNA helicase RecG [Lachnospiraceae bacterium]
PSVMNRLVQGDVGSGKTIVAFLAMYETALNGWQSALMAPTEVLARQHAENFRKLSDDYGLGLSIELLTGSMSAKEKKEAYERIATHRTDIVIGTHALIQEKAHYEDLALVITDEQHRFGVNQRRALTEKGQSPHVLVMSATPIPRTLALILYGDMDISVMDELPKNRLPVKNAVVDIGYRGKAYSFIRKQVDEGHQAYVICPMVEESETSEGENVEDYAKVLRQALPPYIRVEYLHGKMKNDEKEALMTAFSKNEIQVLVSTTVIEVGIDVPNATVILIENAERFGLAQLHQLRGRVGRGSSQSYCIMVDTTLSEESKKRLQVLNDSNDGFFIASEDLKMRGPGDFFGLRQSGDIAFRMGDIYTDAAILKQAEEAAERTLSEENVKGAAAVL